MSRKWNGIAAPIWLIAIALLIAAKPAPARAEAPTAAQTAAFNTYIATLEARLTQQHSSGSRFVTLPADTSRLHSGELVIEKLTPPAEIEPPGAMLHHWRGTTFVPGATAADFERLMRDYDSYPKIYAPQVVSARVLTQLADSYQVTMRVRQKHVITVNMETAYDVIFGQLDDGHRSSSSRSTRINEIADAGTAQEHALSTADGHGYLWRLNNYWSSEERDGGLYMQIESVSLTRSVPTGLGWIIDPFVESVPRESLEFTLRSTRDALKK